MPTNEQREEFAKKLMEIVRDNAIRDADFMNNPHSNAFMSKRWYVSMDKKEMIEAVIPDVVDLVIYHLLYAIDNDLMTLYYTDKDSAVVNLSKSKELAGWFMMGNESWRHKYSKERFIDDCEGLT